MARFALGVSYQGNQYSGWQRQAEVPSVQACLESALSQIADSPIVTLAAGRTDKGVHAVGQIVDFETDIERPMVAWTRGVNSLLPQDIRVHWIKAVPSDFSARRDAIWRHYVYLLSPSTFAPAIYRQGVTWTHRSVDIEAMRAAAQYWLGEHDFSAFRRAGCQSRHARRNLMQFDIFPAGPLVVFSVRANAFVLHMVRNFVGTLLKIGYGEAPVEWAKTVLLSQDRKQAGKTAPPEGLYLYRVGYPDVYGFPSGPHEQWCLPGCIEERMAGKI